MKRIVQYSLVLAVIAAAVLPARAEDWPQYRGLDRDGIVASPAIATDWSTQPPQEAWSKEIGIGYGGISIANGKVYVLGNTDGQDTLYCLSAADGSEIWTRSYQCKQAQGGFMGPRSAPTVSGDKVYTLSLMGHLNCFDAATGQPEWQRDVRKFGAQVPKWGLACSPLIVGDLAIVDAGVILAFDKASGELVWKSASHVADGKDKDGPAGYSSPIAFEVEGETYIAAFPDDGLVILDTEGNQKAFEPWTTSWDVNAAMPIVYPDGRVFVTSGYKRNSGMYRFDGETLEEVWRNNDVGSRVNTPVSHDGYLYGIDGWGGRASLVCLDEQTGEVVWRADEGETRKLLGAGSLLRAGDKLVLLGEKTGALVLADASPQSYNQRGVGPKIGGTCWTMPTLADGRVYCRNYRKNDKISELHCFDVRRAASAAAE